MDSAILGLLGRLMVATVGQIAVLWYKLGRIEQKVEGVGESVRELADRVTRLDDRLDRANISR